MTSTDGLHRHVPSTNGDREVVSRDAIGIPRGQPFSAIRCRHRWPRLRPAPSGRWIRLFRSPPLTGTWENLEGSFYSLQYYIPVALNAIYLRRCCVSFSHVRNVLSNSSYLENNRNRKSLNQNKWVLCRGRNWIQTKEPRPLCDKWW